MMLGVVAAPIRLVLKTTKSLTQLGRAFRSKLNFAGNIPSPTLPPVPRDMPQSRWKSETPSSGDDVTSIGTTPSYGDDAISIGADGALATRVPPVCGAHLVSHAFWKPPRAASIEAAPPPERRSH